MTTSIIGGGVRGLLEGKEGISIGKANDGHAILLWT